MVHVQKWSQDISQDACWAFAYLSAPADTTVVTGGTYYPIAGTFTNVIIRNFEYVATPWIKYINWNHIFFKINWCATLSSNHTNCTVTLWIKKNWVLQTGSLMSSYCKTIWELYNIAWVYVWELDHNDVIQLVLTADWDGDVVTINKYTTAMCEFFDKL